MLVISHRGNVSGKDPSIENDPTHIDRCIRGLEINVEVDLWIFENNQFVEFWLGHDEPQYEVSFEWLFTRRNFLWIHCKNMLALVYLHNHHETEKLNFFWHETDDFTMTSRGFIWAYPGIDVSLPIRGIAVMPEDSGLNIRNFYGICTDTPEKYLIHDKISFV